MKTIGDKLKYIRQKLNKTQFEMAEFIGIKGQSTYGNYERNINEVSLGVLSKLRENGINLNWLFDDTCEPFESDLQKKLKPNDEIFEIPIMAEIGAGEIYDDIKIENGIKIILPWRPYKGEIAFKVSGDSMETTLYDGDYVTAVKCNPERIKYGMDYIVVSEIGSQVKKVIKDGDKIALVSRNPKYLGQKTVPKTILSVWEIISRVSPYRVPEESDPEKVIKIVGYRNN